MACKKIMVYFIDMVVFVYHMCQGTNNVKSVHWESWGLTKPTKRVYK